MRGDIVKDQINKIYFQLPAYSHKDIMERTGLSKSQVVSALSYLRRNPREFGWTVAHGTRGTNAADNYRFHCILLDKNSKFECDKGAEIAIKSGHISTLNGWATQGENQATALRSMAANHMARPEAKYLMRTLAGEAEHMAKQVHELIELINAA